MLRSEVKENYKWKLEDIYPTDSAWEREYTLLTEKTAEIETWKAGCTQSSAALAEAYRKIDEISLLCERLYVYARMRRDEDNANAVYQAMADRAQSINVKASAALSFFDPALLGVGEETLRSWIKTQPALADYAFGIRDLLRAQTHVLSEKEENILSRAGDFSGGAKDIFTMLNNADLDFGTVDGKPLTHGSYILFMQDPDRLVRKKAFDRMYQTYQGMINTIAAAYSTSVKKDVFYASVRGFDSALERALFADDVPKELYTNLIGTVRKNIGVMHDYVDLKQQLLGLPDMHMYDIYAPLIPEDKKEYTYEQACELVLQAMAPLGQDYVDLLSRAIRERWIDVEETKGKTSGAYSWGCYGTHPYVLLNHRGDLDSVFTIAHELGHALHSYYSNEAQPYSLSGYTIFVAEVASTVNEILLTEYLLKNADDQTKKTVLNHYLDQFRTTVVRQTMFAEFEMLTHRMAENGQPLTPESLCAVYAKLNAEYHGKNMCKDEMISYEWARIPHFYNAFYVYKYATGFSCAVNIVKNIRESGSPDAYRAFLKTGGSDYPLKELETADVHLKTGEPVEACMQEFASALDTFKSLFK